MIGRDLQRRLFRDRHGVAAVEMAMVAPILLLLTLGSTDMGNFFLSEHVVQKAVRDGARYAARQPMAAFVSGGSAGTGCRSTPTEPTNSNIQRLVRTGQIAIVSGAPVRLSGWGNDSTVTITVSCVGSAGGSNMTGIYSGLTYGSGSTALGAPVVTVSASVPYSSLFGLAGLPNPTLTLYAKSQAAVMGI